jgi:signal transduction histidine kinase
LQLFRVVQEAINNIEKHARAKSVKLQIRFQGESVVLKIQDDGRGFEVKAPHFGKKPLNGLGLSNMRERALSLGGTCEVTSVPGLGTTIVVHMPLKARRKPSLVETGMTGDQEQGF